MLEQSYARNGSHPWADADIVTLFTVYFLGSLAGTCWLIDNPFQLGYAVDAVPHRVGFIQAQLIGKPFQNF